METTASSVLFTFQVEGGEVLERRLEGVVRDLGDWRPFFAELTPSLYAHLEQVFGSQGAANRGGSWQPLSEKYAVWKAKHYPGMPILTATRRLRGSLTDQNHPDAIHDVTADTLVIGSKVRTPNGKWNLGLIHQMGTKDGRIPARQIFAFPDSLTHEWVGMLRRRMATWDQ